MARPRTVADTEALARARATILEHGPGVSLARLSAAVGLSPPALVKRFGSKEQLLFRALLPAEPPRWSEVLQAPPGPDPQGVLVEVLVELCETFVDVGPALAALRMSPVEVDRVFPPGEPGPSLRVRADLARWLTRAGVRGDVEALADAAVGAAEARGLLTWVAPQLVDGEATVDWATRLARVCLER